MWETMDESGSVTLIFYAVDTTRLFSEPFLNILAAVGQLSRYTHVEIAIGSAAGSSGSMTNVARVFNDATGVELTDRTGMNPKCVCSQTRTHTCVFHTLPPFAQVHVPSNRLQPISRAQDDHVCSRSGWKTVFKQCDGPVSFLAKANNATELLLCRYDRTHCLVLCVRASTNPHLLTIHGAELVADILRVGGLIDPSSNPGAATPAGLYDLYKRRATTTANPYLLRQANCKSTLTTTSLVSSRATHAPETASRADFHIGRQAAIALQVCGTMNTSERLSSGLHVLNRGVGGGARPSAPTLPMGLTLNSLDMRTVQRR